MAVIPMELHGTDLVLSRMNKRIKKLGNPTTAGVLEAALIIYERAQELVVVGPTGNLRADSGAKPLPGATAPTAIIFYNALYAPFVHEIDIVHKVGQWKWLETAINEKKRAALIAIKNAMKVGL